MLLTRPALPCSGPPLLPGGVLAVSRSFGNRMLKQFIIPHPEICDLLLNERECLGSLPLRPGTSPSALCWVRRPPACLVCACCADLLC